ncbi:hypothetical protein FRB94_004356 [Tulasnella sp. JGI-2019a]|nr:hypothetical protein FRB94_004356 [Tulasnella sp. JGI-2019a]
MLQLPPELTVATLSHATLKDVVRCKRVCKTLETIINESIALQYLIELGCAGYVDGNYEKGALPQHERLRRLNEIESAWGKFSLAVKARFKLPGATSSIYEFYGGVFIRGQAAGTRLETIRFPSTFGDVSAETRNFAHSQLAVKAARDIAIDPGSDLLVLIEVRDDGMNNGASRIYDFHIRTLSGCLPHVAARQSIITYAVDREAAYVANTAIIGDLLSVMFSRRSQDNKGGELVVWNWKTSEKIVALEGSFPPSTTCTFLSPAVFVIPQTEQTADKTPKLRAYLAVYAISPHEEGRLVPPRLIATYNLPAFSSKVIECVMVVRSDPAPCAQYFAHTGDSSATGLGSREDPRHPLRSKPFYVDPLKRIFVIGMQVTRRRRPRSWLILMPGETIETEEFTVFLHSDAFSELLGEQYVRTGLPSISKKFNWDEYCQYARMTNLRPRTNYVCFVYGQRYLDYEENPNGNQLHIWDFNPCRVMRKRLSTQNQSEGDKQKTELFNEGDGGEAAHSSAPANEPDASSPSEKQPAESTNSKWALAPLYDSEPDFIQNAVFKDKKVQGLLPFRRITSRARFADLNGAMMDDERIILLKKNSEAAQLELAVMSIVQEPLG